MQARTLSPAAIFGFDIRYVIPLFQRPYVWNEQDQWAPLWEDVRTVAENLLTAPAGYLGPEVSPHFLGAIVLDQPLARAGYIAARYVVDGQQRLTTLQLLLDAAQWVAQQHGSRVDAQALEVLVRNKPEIAQQREELFKVWPTDRDQAAFEAAMDDEMQVPKDLAGTAIARAHDYFVQEIKWWALAPGGSDGSEARLRALVQTLRDHLKLVVIDLEPGDNAQVIFETLNHRGAPLLAADLIKNFIFQLAGAQALDVTGLYRKHWQELDGEYWRERIARGRQYVPRIDIFVNYWLVARFQKEVPADRIFTTFRDQVIRQKLDVPTLLAELSTDARIYSDLEKWPAGSVVGRFRYRAVEALNSAVVTPLLRWQEQELPVAQRDKALNCLESWLVRRSLCRYTSKDINRMMFDLLAELEEAGPAQAGDIVEAFLAAQTADSRLWPSDDAVRKSLEEEPLYTALLRARLRMVLEALEDRRRTGKSEEALCPRNLTVEHILPQAWREHWLNGVTTEDEKRERDSLVHTLGNLTLVNNRLNPALSNRPWTDEEAVARGLGTSGKRTELAKHSTLKLNADLVHSAAAHWDHDLIRARTAELTEAILEIWPASAKLAPQPAPAMIEREASTAGAESAGEGKYQPLTQWLVAQTADDLTVTFDDLEDVLGVPLAPSARKHSPYWYSPANSLAKAIAAGGFKASGVNLTEERLVLRRRG
ncbi:DUF262 domain-containing protein [Actinoplanes missouriensis]|uniref:DUF262 domain-containing protein n=1 Tax=Actinoplanes missouriensis TaxID=1866 RepID=UPI0033F2DC45